MACSGLHNKPNKHPTRIGNPIHFSMVHGTRIELVFPPWKGSVLTDRRIVQITIWKHTSDTVLNSELSMTGYPVEACLHIITIWKYIREVLDTHHQLASSPHYRSSCSVAFLEFGIVLVLWLDGVSSYCRTLLLHGYPACAVTPSFTPNG